VRSSIVKLDLLYEIDVPKPWGGIDVVAQVSAS
jgi:hypothetical protein